MEETKNCSHDDVSFDSDDLKDGNFIICTL